MRRTLSAFGAGLAVIAGSCSDPVSTNAALIMAVVVDQIVYTPADRVDLETGAVGEQYTTVARHIDCSEGVWLDENTHVSDHCPLEDGESNYLPEGTPIHRVQGVDPGEALTVFYGDEWQRLQPVDGPGVTQ